MPVIGLPGNPRSALVVFRLLGHAAGAAASAAVPTPPPEPAVRARLARDLASAAGRLDVVQVRVRDGVADPALRRRRRCCPSLTARRRLRRSCPRRRPASTRAPRSTSPCTAERRVMADSPFIRDVPAAEALAAWRDARAPRGLPGPAAGVAGAGCRGRRRAASPPSRCGPPAPRRRSTRPAWTGSRCGPPTPSARARPRRSTWRRAPTTWWTPATRCRAGRDAVVMREHVHYDGRGRRAARRRAALPARALDRRGRQRGRAAAARGPPAAGRRRRRRRGGGRHASCWSGARPVVAVLPTGRRGAADRRADRRRARSSTPTR